MKRLVAFLLAILMFATSLPARADDTNLPDVPDAVLTPMEKNDKAPFQGVLLSPEAIANIIADYRAFGDKLKVELDRVHAEDEASKKFAISEVKISCEADKKIIREQLTGANKRIKILVDDQKKNEKSQKNVMIWTITGVAFGLVLGGLSGYGVSSITK